MIQNKELFPSYRITQLEVDHIIAAELGQLHKNEVCIYIYVHIYIYVYVCIYIYIHI
jgi:hypothetical protein